MQNYVNRQGNPATFETLDEVRANAPVATAKLSGNDRMRLVADPKLENFPKDLVYIYRSPDLYGGETAARNNRLKRMGYNAARELMTSLGMAEEDEGEGTVLEVWH